MIACHLYFERWGEDPPKRGAAWLARTTGASLAPGERAFKRTAVKIWVEKPLLWADYEATIDPMSAMMTAWYAAVDGRVHPWS
jgi:hypothetical protein